MTDKPFIKSRWERNVNAEQDRCAELADAAAAELLPLGFSEVTRNALEVVLEDANGYAVRFSRTQDHIDYYTPAAGLKRNSANYTGWRKSLVGR